MKLNHSGTQHFPFPLFVSFVSLWFLLITIPSIYFIIVKLRSFRLRIALLSAMLAGVAVVGFGSVAWNLIYTAKLNRLDAKLENQVRRSVRPRPGDRWQQMESLLPQELGTDADTPVALLAVSTDNQLLYRSPDWSDEFAIHTVLPIPSPLPSPLPFPSPSPNRSDSGSFDRDRRLGEPEFKGDRPDFAGFRRDSDRERFRDSEFRRNRLPEPVLPPAILVTRSTNQGSWRIGAMSSPAGHVAIAVSLAAIDQEMELIRNIFLVAIPGTLLLVAVGAWGLAGGVLRPVRRLTMAMQQVTVAGLDQRVPLGSTDVEFVELIQVFNQMLERLGRSFKQASRFSADAAHELKTPLAILQGELERSMHQAGPGSEQQQALSTLLDEVRRLHSIVRKLLLLSLADAGQMSFHKATVNLSDLLAVMVEDLELLAPDLQVQPDIAPGLQVLGDRDLLTQVLQNLISNAIKYNLPSGWIRIEAMQRLNHAGASVQITVTNASKGIAVEERDRIFDRFYRGDPARTRKVEGVGLGLSLSREIARAHQGELMLDRTVAGETAFTLMLPPGL